MIALLISIAMAQDVNTFDVVRMNMNGNKNCPALLEQSMKASKQKDLEILDLKNRLMEMELQLMRAGQKK